MHLVRRNNNAGTREVPDRGSDYPQINQTMTNTESGTPSSQAIRYRILFLPF